MLVDPTLWNSMLKQATTTMAIKTQQHDGGCNMASDQEGIAQKINSREVTLSKKTRQLSEIGIREMPIRWIQQ